MIVVRASRQATILLMTPFNDAVGAFYEQVNALWVSRPWQLQTMNVNQVNLFGLH
jgi:hypothetical protein